MGTKRKLDLRVDETEGESQDVFEQGEQEVRVWDMAIGFAVLAIILIVAFVSPNF